MMRIIKYNTYEITVLHLNILYIFYPFSPKTFLVCVHDKEANAEVTSVYRKSFWKEGKANAVEIMWSGKEGETVLLEIPKDVLSRKQGSLLYQMQGQGYSICQQLGIALMV